MPGKMKCEPVKQRSRGTVEEMLRSSVAEQVSEALWSATYYDPDWRWVQTQCLFSLTHTNAQVRSSAATCLGLLAVFHKKLDLDLVVPALKKAADDPEVKAFAEDSLDDIQHTLALKVKPS
jgi:hypothetical protein